MLLRHPLVLYNYCRFVSHCQSWAYISWAYIGIFPIKHRDHIQIINNIFTHNIVVFTAWSTVAAGWRINGPKYCAWTTSPGMRCAQKRLHNPAWPTHGPKALWVGYQRPCPSKAHTDCLHVGISAVHLYSYQHPSVPQYDGSQVPPSLRAHAEAGPLLRRGGLRRAPDVLHLRLPDTGRKGRGGFWGLARAGAGGLCTVPFNIVAPDLL